MKIKYLPATIDPCDGLNKRLDSFSLRYYQRLFNSLASAQINRQIDFERRPYFAQISRFDPSKGISDLIDAYLCFRHKISEEKKMSLMEIPQLVITGHGSIDDPEGSLIYNQVLGKLKKIQNSSSKESQWINDIIVIRLGPSDQILNAVLSGAMIAFQLSLREGFEVKVSEALWKGIPVVAYQSGGISLQIKDGENGYLIETGNVSAVCQAMYQLTVDKKLYEKCRKAAQAKKEEWIFSPSNVHQWNKILLDI